ncbi:uncharacterized protein FTOL_12058 [Fusarium torulosum]|uniref:Uncharacterized protein n=1 Tax=Fusarium torulosum TaxID=33205 RepID=A0AAE8SNK1_9HYPO|nr:uncharacterized protein FTOL_12058 [Fusarium torulosum]
MAMAELGCDHVTVPGDILFQLSLLDYKANPPPGLTHQIKLVFRLSAWYTWPALILLPAAENGNLSSTDIDHLADNGAALTKAIAAGPVTERGLFELEAFKSNEVQSRRTIEEIFKQFK